MMEASVHENSSENAFWISSIFAEWLNVPVQSLKDAQEFQHFLDHAQRVLNLFLRDHAAIENFYSRQDVVRSSFSIPWMYEKIHFPLQFISVHQLSSQKISSFLKILHQKTREYLTSIQKDIRNYHQSCATFQDFWFDLPVLTLSQAQKQKRFLQWFSNILQILRGTEISPDADYQTAPSFECFSHDALKNSQCPEEYYQIAENFEQPWGTFGLSPLFWRDFVDFIQDIISKKLNEIHQILNPRAIEVLELDKLISDLIHGKDRTYQTYYDQNRSYIEYWDWIENRDELDEQMILEEAHKMRQELPSEISILLWHHRLIALNKILISKKYQQKKDESLKHGVNRSLYPVDWFFEAQKRLKSEAEQFIFAEYVSFLNQEVGAGSQTLTTFFRTSLCQKMMLDSGVMSWSDLCQIENRTGRAFIEKFVEYACCSEPDQRKQELFDQLMTQLLSTPCLQISRFLWNLHLEMLQIQPHSQQNFLQGADWQRLLFDQEIDLDQAWVIEWICVHSSRGELTLTHEVFLLKYFQREFERAKLFYDGAAYQNKKKFFEDVWVLITQHVPKNIQIFDRVVDQSQSPETFIHKILRFDLELPFQYLTLLIQYIQNQDDHAVQLVDKRSIHEGINALLSRTFQLKVGVPRKLLKSLIYHNDLYQIHQIKSLFQVMVPHVPALVLVHGFELYLRKFPEAHGSEEYEDAVKLIFSSTDHLIPAWKQLSCFIRKPIENQALLVQWINQYPVRQERFRQKNPKMKNHLLENDEKFLKNLSEETPEVFSLNSLFGSAVLTLAIEYQWIDFWRIFPKTTLKTIHDYQKITQYLLDHACLTPAFLLKFLQTYPLVIDLAQPVIDYAIRMKSADLLKALTPRQSEEYHIVDDIYIVDDPFAQPLVRKNFRPGDMDYSLYLFLEALNSRDHDLLSVCDECLTLDFSQTLPYWHSQLNQMTLATYCIEFVDKYHQSDRDFSLTLNRMLERYLENEIFHKRIVPDLSRNPHDEFDMIHTMAPFLTLSRPLMSIWCELRNLQNCDHSMAEEYLDQMELLFKTILRSNLKEVLKVASLELLDPLKMLLRRKSFDEFCRELLQSHMLHLPVKESLILLEYIAYHSLQRPETVIRFFKGVLTPDDPEKIRMLNQLVEYSQKNRLTDLYQWASGFEEQVIASQRSGREKIKPLIFSSSYDQSNKNQKLPRIPTPRPYG